MVGLDVQQITAAHCLPHLVGHDPHIGGDRHPPVVRCMYAKAHAFGGIVRRMERPHLHIRYGDGARRHRRDGILFGQCTVLQQRIIGTERGDDRPVVAPEQYPQPGDVIAVLVGDQHRLDAVGFDLPLAQGGFDPLGADTGVHQQPAARRADIGAVTTAAAEQRTIPCHSVVPFL